MIAVGGPSSLWAAHLWAGRPGFYEQASGVDHGEQAQSVAPQGLCSSSCCRVPALAAFDDVTCKLNKPFLPSFPKQCFITATKSKPEQLGTRRKILPTPPKRKTGIKYQITYSPHTLSLGKILDPKQSQRDRDRHGMQETRNGPRKGRRCLPPRMMVKGDEKSRTRYPELVRGQDLWRALP